MTAMTAPRLLAVVLLAGAAPALATPAPVPASASCPQVVDVRNVMTVTEFDQAGLDKLSKAQLAALNRWLGRYVHALCVQMRPPAAAAPAVAPPPPHPRAQAGAAPAPATGAAAATSEAVFGKPPAAESEPSRIDSRIVGEFHGWTGDTVFRLQNGQVWKQAGPGYFETKLKSPKVVIKKLLIGYVLQVDGYAKEVFVRRVR